MLVFMISAEKGSIILKLQFLIGQLSYVKGYDAQDIASILAPIMKRDPENIFNKIIKILSAKY